MSSLSGQQKLAWIRYLMIPGNPAVRHESHCSMASDSHPDYEVYQDCLIHCCHGFPQWRADPGRGSKIRIGDVGYCSEGKFKKLIHLDLRTIRGDGNTGIQDPTEVPFPDKISHKHKRKLRIKGGAEVAAGFPVGGGATVGVQKHRYEEAMLQLQDESAQYLYMDKRSTEAVGTYALNRYRSWLTEDAFQGVSVDDIVIIMGTYMTGNWRAKTSVSQSDNYKAGGNIKIASMLRTFFEVDQGTSTATNDSFSCGHLHSDRSRRGGNPYSQYSDCTQCIPPPQNQCIFFRTGRIREVPTGFLPIANKVTVPQFEHGIEGKQEVMKAKTSSGKSNTSSSLKGKGRQKPKDDLELVDSDLFIPDVDYCALLYDKVAQEKFKLVDLEDAVFVTDDDVIRYLGGDPDADKEPADRVVGSRPGLQEVTFDKEKVSTLLGQLSEGSKDVKLSVMNSFITAVSQGAKFQENVLEMDVIPVLLDQLTDEDWHIRLTTVEFFKVAASQDWLPQEKIFNKKIITSLLGVLGDIRKDVKSSVISFIADAASQNGLREQIFEPETACFELLTDEDKLEFGKLILGNHLVAAAFRAGQLQKQIFDTDTVSALLFLLADDHSSWYVRSRIVEIFTAIVCQEFQSQRSYKTSFSILRTRKLHSAPPDELLLEIFCLETITVLATGLSDSNQHVICRHVEFFRAATSQASLRETLFGPQIVLKLRDLLLNEYPEVRSNAVKFFRSAASKDGLRENIFTKETISALLNRLTDSDDAVRLVAVKFFTAAASQDGLRGKIFDMETISMLLGLLTDEHWGVRLSVVEFFIAGGSQDALKDDIFDPRVVNELHKRLTDEKDSRVKPSVLKFWTQVPL